MTHWRDKALLTVAELAAVASLSQSEVRRAIRAERIRVVRMGRAVRIPIAEAQRFVGETSGDELPRVPSRAARSQAREILRQLGPVGSV